MHGKMILVATMLCVAGTGDAVALSRTWLSAAKGLDSNPCTLQAPYRTFTAALSATDAGGEIDFLDPGGYGFAYITKSVSIVNDGIGEAGSQGNGSLNYAITVAAGPTDVVVLRGLTIEGARTTPNGIDFISGRTLTIQNCVIRNFTNFGVWADNTTTSNLQVLNSTISDNTNRGINIAPTSVGSIRGVIDHSTISNNAINIAVDGTNNTGPATNIDKVTISNSLIAFGTDGVDTTANPVDTSVVLRDNVITNNSHYGVYANSNGRTAAMVLANNTISQNGTGIANNGSIFTFDDNYVAQNIADASGSDLIYQGTR